MDKRVMGQSTANQRVSDFSIEAEQQVLGGLMLAEESWDKVCDLLTHDDFFKREHRLMFTAMAALVSDNAPREPMLIADRLGVELKAAGGLAYIGEILQGTVSTANIRHYAEIVRRHADQRRVCLAHTLAGNDLQEPGMTPAERAERAANRMLGAVDGRCDDVPPIKDALKSWQEKLQERSLRKGALVGVSTGFADLDDCTLGLGAGDLVIVGARPSMGKTTLGMNMVESVCRNSREPALVFSMEMGRESLLNRSVAAVGHVDHRRLRSGQLLDEDWPDVGHALAQMREWALEIDDRPARSVEQIAAAARRFRRQQGGKIGVIMVDYIQLMAASGRQSNNRENDVSEISRGLKQIAREMQCPVIALSQLNRGLEQRANKRPLMADLRESGAIEQDADLILFLYRDEVYHPESADRGVAELIVAKQRNGELKTVLLSARLSQCRFENMALGYQRAVSAVRPVVKARVVL